MAEVIKGLWIGDALGTLERLSITSFLRHGHEYHLYCYDTVANVPAGTTIKDGNEILPASAIFRYDQGPGKGSVAAFSNLFRYKLLLDLGGWWVDADFVCMKPFMFSEPILFGAEHTRRGAQATNAVMKLPAGHEVARQCFETASQRGQHGLVWGETGPQLLHNVVMAKGLTQFIKGVSVFCPIPWWGWRLALCDDASLCMPFLYEGTFAIHLWQEMWRRAGIEREFKVPATSLVSMLSRVQGS